MGKLRVHRALYVGRAPGCMRLALQNPLSLTQTLTISPSYLCNVSPKLAIAQWLCFQQEQVYIGLEEMGLIFTSLKTHFLMFVFCTFSLTLKHIDFHFSFDILAQMMEFSAPLYRDCMTENLTIGAMTASEKSTGTFLEFFFINGLV